MGKIYINRRKFVRLSTTAAVGGAAALSGIVLPEAFAFRGRNDEKKIRLGFVGLGINGSRHLGTALGLKGVEAAALCEIIPERLEEANKRIVSAGFPAPKLYGKGPEDFKRMCENEDLDAVICCTSREWHTPVCLAAMKNGKQAVSESPVALTPAEAWELVETFEKTGKWATIALEGYNQLTLLNMIQAGMMGDIVHAEGGNVYDLLPAVDINHGDRVDFLISMRSGVGGNPEAVYNASLIRTIRGKMITLFHAPGYNHPGIYYRIQGTRGVYLGDDQRKSIYLEGHSPVEHAWEPADRYLKENEHPVAANFKSTPDIWWHRLAGSIRENRLPDWDVYDSVTASMLDVISASTAADKGKPFDFPDFTKGKWETNSRLKLV